MTAALVAEYRKLFSTRAWWLLGIVLVAYLGFIGGMMGLSFGYGSEELAQFASAEDLATSVYGLVSSIGYVFPLIIGSLSITTEFRHQTITQSLLVEPRRGLLLAAKLIASVPMGIVYGVLAVVSLTAAAAPFLALLGEGAFLGSGETWRVFGLSVVIFVLWTVMGVSLGALLKNQVLAVVAILAFTQFVEPIARVGLAAFDATTGIAKFLPGSAADAVIGSTLMNQMMTGSGGGSALPGWAGLLVLLGYITIFAFLGRVITFRRDIN